MTLTSDKMTVDKMTSAKIAVYKMTVDKMTADKMTSYETDKTAVDKMTIDKITVDVMTGSKMACAISLTVSPPPIKILIFSSNFIRVCQRCCFWRKKLVPYTQHFIFSFNRHNNLDGYIT